MTRALVLGGGGPVGIAWESGLIEGLASEGISLAEADLVVGTSAGSFVGAQLKAGLDLTATVRALRESREEALSGGSALSGDSDLGGPQDSPLDRLMSAIAAATSGAGSREEAMRAIGHLAVESPGISEEMFLSFFAGLDGVQFPQGFTCTAVDTGSGEFVTWDSGSGVDLQRAVASSSAVPAVYSPVEIKGRLYMDGGMRNPLNADLAAGHDRVLVVSVMMLSLPEGVSNAMFESLSKDLDEALLLLRAGGGAVEVIGPSPRFLEISGYGANLLDLTRVGPAYEEGIRQGAEEAGRVAGLWGV